MLKYSFVFVFLTVFLVSAFSQSIGEIELTEGASVVDNPIAVADELYVAKMYYQAIEYYNQAYETDPQNDYAIYQIAESYRALRYYKEATFYYKKILDHSNKFVFSRFWYGKMLKSDEKYAAAKETFEIFIETYKGQDVWFLEQAKKEIKSCELIDLFRGNPWNVSINNAGPTVNKIYSDFGVVELDDNTIVFTGVSESLKHKKENITDSTEGRYNSLSVNRLFIAKRSKKGFEEREMLNIEPHPKSLSLGAPAISPDKKRLYYSVCNNTSEQVQCKIFYSKNKNGHWTKPINLGYPVNQVGFSSKQPMVSHTLNGEDVLFYVSDKKGGLGDYDIWYTTLDSNQNIVEDKNIGTPINTNKDEFTPFYDARAGILYFSSKEHLGMGEFDIYMSKGEVEYEWSNPINIEYPLNSSADDYYFYLSDNGKSGFLASNRAGGFAVNQGTCCDDIYQFNLEDKQMTFEELLGVSAIQIDFEHKELKSILKEFSQKGYRGEVSYAKYLSFIKQVSGRTENSLFFKLQIGGYKNLDSNQLNVLNNLDTTIAITFKADSNILILGKDSDIQKIEQLRLSLLEANIKDAFILVYADDRKYATLVFALP